MTQQPDLFSDLPTGPLTNKERFDRWIVSVKGQAVYDEVCRLARQLRKQGRQQYGIGAIWESIRFNQDMGRVAEDEGFNLNNTFRSFLSRHIMEREEDLNDFFTTKQQLCK